VIFRKNLQKVIKSYIINYMRIEKTYKGGKKGGLDAKHILMIRNSYLPQISIKLKGGRKDGS